MNYQISQSKRTIVGFGHKIFTSYNSLRVVINLRSASGSFLAYALPPPISYIMFMNESLNCEFSVEMSLNFELAELVTLYYAADYFVEYSLV